MPATREKQEEFPNAKRRAKKSEMKPVPRDGVDHSADEAKRAQHEAAFEKFAATFPDAFYVSERGAFSWTGRKTNKTKAGC